MVCLLAVAAGDQAWHAGSRGFAAEAPEALTSEQTQFFETKIRPVLIEHCYRCHSVEGQGVRGGLMVDSREGLLGGGESGAAIVPGNPEESLLWTAMNHEGLEMPPNRKLPDRILNDFRLWIEMGAPDPRTATGSVVSSRVTPEAIAAGRQFWAFQSPKVKPVPTTTDTTWGRNPIDQYALAAMEAQQLQPAADADPATLVRRIYFDLHGLPPQPEDVRQFVIAWKQNPDQAVAAIVDKLLEQPQYGERWGRHWLDVARYAESSGKEVDMAFPHAWRYRDYVIDAFNNDKPYDQFVQEQLAGDLLPVSSDTQWSDNLIATGFLAIGPKTLIERNPRQFQADLLDEQIDTTTRAILGISVACARCHDHKFDPIPQTDYYALAGIFQSTDTFFGGIASQRSRQTSDLIILPVADPNPFDVALSSQELSALREQLAAKQIENQQAQQAARNAVRNGTAQGNEARNLQVRAAALERELTLLRAKLSQLDSQGQPLSLCMGVQDKDKPVNAKVLIRGEINQPAQEVERGIVQVLSQKPLALPENSSGRLELARWMTSKENPLTARVMVNRIWLHLLGTPLVAETDNFGASGAPPSHPELLDYLAVSFMEGDWSIKAVIRQVMNSRLYRQSTTPRDGSIDRDPENRFFSRANARRLQAEAIRDAMLVASGQLDRDRPRASQIATYGPTLLSPQGTPQLTAANFRERPTPLPDIQANYRSVYLPISRNVLPRVLEVFDFAEPAMVIGQREVSNTATQSLFLLNNPFVIEQSEAFARRIMSDSQSPQQAIRLAFEVAYSREPTSAEMASSMKFIKSTQESMVQSAVAVNRPQRRFRDRLANSTRSPDPVLVMTQFCQALFTTAEFRYVY